MNVAELSLCKELYELSGWEPNDKWWVERYKGNDTVWRVWDEPLVASGKDEGLDCFPAYDLGYLLRKLQQFGVSVRANGFGTWEAETDSEELGDEHEQLEQTWNTPEDAAAKLAIELFKQNILKQEG